MEFYDFDDEYLERLRAGDFRTQEHFVAYFSVLIRNKAGSRMRSRQDIEDVRQETFVRVFAALRKENGIREPKRLGAFVNSVCGNVLREIHRRPKEEQADDHWANGIPDRALSALDILRNKEMEDKVRKVLDAMSERDRRILREVLLEERDKDEVCKDFGVTRDYLRVLVLRAKKKFKSLL